jgi:hypothetical protein
MSLFESFKPWCETILKSHARPERTCGAMQRFPSMELTETYVEGTCSSCRKSELKNDTL